ncbi:hypothetical protein ACFQX7_29195 [Luedemannella flava]
MVSRLVAPLLVFVGVLGFWQFASTTLLEPGERFLLPPPMEVLRLGLFDPAAREQLLAGLWSTTVVALVGLAVSMVVGVSLGLLMSQARWVEISIYRTRCCCRRSRSSRSCRSWATGSATTSPAG